MILSIIIPVFNGENEIIKSISSIYEQYIDNKLFEVIIINDGSTDSTLSIVENYCKNYNNITIINKKNQGVSASRNLGIKIARGDYITFLDADDYLSENSISTILKNIEKYNDKDYLIFNSSFTTSLNRPIFKQYYSKKNSKNSESKFYMNHIRGSIWGIVYKSIFIKKSQLQFPDGVKNGEDTIFNALSFIYSKNLKYINYSIYRVYKRENSASRNWDYERIIEALKALKYIKEYILTHSLEKWQKNVLWDTNLRLISTILQESIKLKFNRKERNFIYYNIKKNSISALLNKQTLHPLKTIVYLVNLSYYFYCLKSFHIKR